MNQAVFVESHIEETAEAEIDQVEVQGWRTHGPRLPLGLGMYQEVRGWIRGNRRGTWRRDLALVAVQISTSLRASDLLALRVGDVIDNAGGIRAAVAVRQRKTNSLVWCQFTGDAVGDLAEWCRWYRGARGEWWEQRAPLWPVVMAAERRPLGYRAYAYLVEAAIVGVGADPRLYGTHSLRAALPARYYRETGDTIGAQQLFGHKQLATSARYLQTVAIERAAQARGVYAFWGAK